MRISTFVLLICIAGASEALPPNHVLPEEVALSGKALERIDRIALEHVQAGHAAGMVTLVARRGKIAYLRAAGAPYMGSDRSLRTDDVIFAASLTKPIVAAAVLMMVESGVVGLDDTVAKFLPEYRIPSYVRIPKTVSPESRSTSGPASAPKVQYTTVPTRRAITVRDLLTHTSGFQTFRVPNDAIPSRPDPEDTLQTFVSRIAGAPLDWQPGTKWGYSNIAGFDVLGRIIEVASGQGLAEFLQQRIFEPLGMRDTGFLGQRSDLVPRAAPMAPKYADHPYVMGKPYVSGSGLWTTAEDYWRFAQMLLDEGRTLSGKRLLRPSSIAAMTNNQTGDLMAAYGGLPGADAGFGFGFGVLVLQRDAAAGLPFSRGAFGWDGQSQRRFWVDRRKQLVIVMMILDGLQGDHEKANAVLVQRDLERAAVAAIQ